MSSFLHWSTATGPPIQVGGTRFTPESRVLTVRLPFGGFVSNRPTAVLAERGGESQRRVAIRDVTRQAQIGIALLTVVVWLIVNRSLKGARQ